MRVSREKALENREQIIETAARLLRKHGFEGIGVADIMKAAGLTHGGFYRNFASKDDLAVKASERAIADTAALLKDGLAQQPKDPFRELIERYVSSTHRDDPGSGCILPALAVDAARSDDPALRAVFITAIQDYLEQIADGCRGGGYCRTKPVGPKRLGKHATRPSGRSAELDLHI